MAVKLTQNQYYGNENEIPNSLTAGSTYIAVDTDKIFIYNEQGEPIEISTASLTGVPYTGAVTDLDMGANGITTNSLQVSGGAGAEGTLTWNATEATMDLQSGGVTYQLGQEIAPLVRNTTGNTIANGTPVRFAGSLGASGRVLIAPAIADGSVPSSYILGVTTEEISNNSDGHVTWFGKVRGIPTDGSNYGQTWIDGDLIYVSEVTAGFLTNVKPDGPNAQIFIGVVINASPANGDLFVRPSWRGLLIDLEDVNGPATITGQIPVWNDTLGLFQFSENILNYNKPGTTGTPFLLEATPSGASTYSDSNGVVYLNWVGVSGQYNLTLPSAATEPYRVIRFINDGTIGANDKVNLVAPGVETIDGAALYILNKPYGGVQAWSDGTNWIIMQAKG
jgi:hypothetical protein